MQLPPDLHAALDAELGTTSTRQIAGAAAALSRRYRDGHARTTLFQESADDVAAYAAYRLPATYVAATAAMEDVRESRPDMNPESILDAGGGPGTAAWAAVQTWPPIRTVTVLDRDAEMLRLGQALAAHSNSPALKRATWLNLDVTASWPVAAAGVTVAAYLLGELEEQGRVHAIDQLWAYTTDSCLIVEPGTPRGFQIVQAATERLVSAGAHIIAPFPPHWTCTESATDWCHFARRVPRTRLHRSAKGADLAYEDEKYTYVAASRYSGIPIAARVIRQPQIRTGHVRLTLCTPQGVEHIVVTRSNKAAWRRARDLRWGEAIRVDEAEAFGLGSKGTGSGP